jgi:hypothetical protein
VACAQLGWCYERRCNPLWRPHFELKPMAISCGCEWRQVYESADDRARRNEAANFELADACELYDVTAERATGR